MNVFMTENQAKDYGLKELGKYECEVCYVNGKKTLLCGTPLVYEDLIWNTVNGLLRKLHVNIFDETITWDWYLDESSELRDIILEKFLDYNNLKLLHASEEY